MTDMVPEHWVDRSAALAKRIPSRGWAAGIPAVGEVILAPPTGPCDAQRLGWVCDEVQSFVDEVGGKGAFVFKLGLFLVEWVAPIWSFKLPRFRTMDFETRVRVLEKFESSPFGMTLLAVKLFLCIPYFEHPDTAPEVGFDGAPLIRSETP